MLELTHSRQLRKTSTLNFAAMLHVALYADFVMLRASSQTRHTRYHLCRWGRSPLEVARLNQFVHYTKSYDVLLDAVKDRLPADYEVRYVQVPRVTFLSSMLQ